MASERFAQIHDVFVSHVLQNESLQALGALSLVPIAVLGMMIAAGSLSAKINGEDASVVPKLIVKNLFSRGRGYIQSHEKAKGTSVT